MISDKLCLAPSPDGYACTEESNHCDNHRTVLGTEILDEWPNKDPFVVAFERILLEHERSTA